ncbi:MAG TPA: hypothetical protein VKR41_06595 [Puia sp.]|nr:hypothetical protein [Puia sp.]
MKTTALYRFLFFIAFTGILASCNKNSSNSNNGSSSTDLQTTSDDATRVSTETDAAFDDVNTAMVTNYGVTGAALGRELMQRVVDGPGSADSTAICDAVITLDTANGNRQITITYNGTNCALNRTRKGSVTITWPLGQLWSTAGAVVTVNFNSLAITRLLDNKTITLNGTHTYTNVSGGSLIDLPNAPTGTTITHTITSSNMQITFDNGTQRTWSVDRQRVFTYSGGYVITTSGLYTSGSTPGISEWGTDRFGNAFTVDIVQPRVISQACSWQMTAGEVALTNTAGVTTVTYGLNASGTATTCPVGDGTYYFELSWTAASNGKKYTFILPY